MSKMVKSASVRPTDAELQILSVLWSRGESTVREIHDAINQARPSAESRREKSRGNDAGKPVGYTTTLKFLQIMADKRLVTRDKTNRSHVYRPALAESVTQTNILRYLLDRAFGGSMRKLVLSALSAKPSTPEELAEIQQLLNDRKGKQS